MNFVTFAEFYKDISDWEKTLPHFDAVCGIPRSGVLPATLIALKRNIRLVAWESLMLDQENCINNALIRSNNPLLKKENGKKILVVDDSTSENGVTLAWAKKCLVNCPLDVTYGVVYYAETKNSSDLTYKLLPQPRLFEWNWLRNARIANVLFDCDGDLCEDWTRRLEQLNDPEFLAHVTNAKPVHIPQYRILGVVTSRIEKYRAQTTRWLNKQGIVFDHLIMHPAKTPEERRMLRDHGVRKAAAYDQLNASLFVESDEKQAKQIHEITGRPVLCTDTMTFYKKG